MLKWCGYSFVEGAVPMMGTRTYSAKPGEVERRWYVVNAQGKVLGRLATEVA